MKRILKWTGIALGSLVGVVVVLAGVLYFMGGSKLNAAVEVPDEGIAVAADSATLARGHYLVNIHACAECHGENFGGQVFAEAPPFLAVASNLTGGQGGIGTDYTDADWERAIRHGVGRDGRGLIIMPAALYNSISNDELAAMIAYLRTLPPVDNELPPSEVRPMGRIIAGTGGFYTAAEEIDHQKSHADVAPPHGATVEYGRYRTTTACTYCHGQDLHGGSQPIEPGTPIPPDLYSVTGWSLDQFTTALRTGVTPSGHNLNPVVMPWGAFKHMNDAEIEAIYNYLQTLEPASPPPAADAAR